MLDLQHQPRRIFQQLLEPDEEGDRLAAVHQAVIVAESATYIIGRISILSSMATGRFWMVCMPRMPDCGGLRIGRGEQRAEDAAVGDGEGAAGELVDGELAFAGARWRGA